MGYARQVTQCPHQMPLSNPSDLICPRSQNPCRDPIRMPPLVPLILPDLTSPRGLWGSARLVAETGGDRGDRGGGTIRDKTNTWGHCGHLGTPADEDTHYYPTKKGIISATICDFIFPILIPTWWEDVCTVSVYQRYSKIAYFLNFYEAENIPLSQWFKTDSTANISWLHRNNMLTKITVQLKPTVRIQTVHIPV